jgi:predicted RecA/RadA family phage recombinase
VAYQATYVQYGDTIDYTPGTAVSAGQVVVENGVVGVSAVDIPANELGALTIDGVFDFAKGAAAFARGDLVCWDDANNVATPTGTGVPLGKAVAAAVSGDATVRVKLSPNGANRLPSATVAATGSTQANAAAVQEGFTLVTAADGTKGVLLPAAAPGMQVTIKNGAAAILKIWPASGDAINAIAADSALSIASLTSVILTAYDATTWYTVPLLPS